MHEWNCWPVKGLTVVVGYLSAALLVGAGVVTSMAAIGGWGWVEASHFGLLLGSIGADAGFGPLVLQWLLKADVGDAADVSVSKRLLRGVGRLLPAGPDPIGGYRRQQDEAHFGWSPVPGLAKGE